jgi:hypothetical protein
MESVLDHRYPVVLRLPRVTDLVLARAFGPWLDESLATGRPPESSHLLSARARDIVSMPRRTAIARNWEQLLRIAREVNTARNISNVAAAPKGGAVRRPAVPVRRDRVLAAEPAIRELTDSLLVPLPVPVRGVAMAAVLLTDGAGPVYNRQCGTDLTAAVRDAVAHMDPARPLLRDFLSNGPWCLCTRPVTRIRRSKFAR